MLADAQNTYSSFQAITATAASTNVLRKKAGSLGFGPGGHQLWLLVLINQTFTNLTNLALAWQTDDNVSFSSATTLDTRTITLASGNLAAGKSYAVAAPFDTIEEYTRMYYTVTGTAPDAGQVTAMIVDQLDALQVVAFS